MSNDLKATPLPTEDESTYDSMVRSLTNRPKNKRQIKLLENQLIQFAFGESDSEEDEDFTVGEGDLNSDDSNLGDTQIESSDEEADDDDDKSDSDANTEGESDADDIRPSKQMRLGDVFSAFQNQTEEMSDSTVPVIDETSTDHTIMAYKKPFLICGICLESEDTANDEILVCDFCGISVHEGCYGDIDMSDDDDKSESDAPTEPWFCEVCKAGMKEVPICELCPSLGGIYKQTDTGKWVHLICALYTPYIGFRDVSKLQTVVLEDMKPTMWGSNECLFCNDDNFSRTGVCIQCDAGLCKATFHVTCGQRNGFLSDIPDRKDSDTNAADLLYAHCKLHTVKLEMKKRKNSWLAFESNVSKFKQPLDSLEQERIKVTLEHAKRDYQEFRRNIVQGKALHEYPRLLSTCPEACMMLARKAEILGVLKHPGYNVKAALVSGRISKHEAHLSAEYVNYFFKREMQVTELEHKMNTATPVLTKLEKEQTTLTTMSNEYQTRLNKVLEEKDDLLSACKELHRVFCKLAGRTLKYPSVLKPKQEEESKAKMFETNKLLHTIVKCCATCKSTENQHLLVKCETCTMFYHLACVDPPLTRMPKKSDKYLWQCTECDSSDESGTEVDDDEDVEGVKRRKRTVKEPEKYTPESIPLKENTKETVKRKISSGKKSEEPLPKKLKKVKKEEHDKKAKEKIKEEKKIDNTPIKERRRSKPYQPVVKKVEETFHACCICTKGGDKTNLVKCDECKKCYHFKTCLDPPFSKTPKGRYYGWICEDCDESEDEPVEDEPVKDELVEVKNKPY